MWLIDVETHDLRDHLGDEAVPPYAILSHTWGREEVTFQEWQDRHSLDVKAKQGYRKIEQCCRQAKEDGLAWAWVDTCCIDKRSSAELSEAINSMFRWYKCSSACYAYLEDISDIKGRDTDFSACRWFTRGWTLQEILAPSEIVFYGAGWTRIGAKTELAPTLEQASGIRVEYLLGADLDTASVSRRMSWAAHRETTRAEDTAYCLMGLFNINMPLLYGEGRKAFKRLQEEIMRLYPEDHTLFAWGTYLPDGSEDFPDHMPEDRIDGVLSVEQGTKAEAEPQPLLGLLADSPRDFEGSGDLTPFVGITTLAERNDAQQVRTEVRGRDIIIQLPVLFREADLARYVCPHRKTYQFRPSVIGFLLCGHYGEDDYSLACLNLHFWGRGTFGRTREILLYLSGGHPSYQEDAEYFFESDESLLGALVNTVRIGPEVLVSPANGDFNLRRIYLEDSTHCRLMGTQYSHLADRIHDRTLRPTEDGWLVRYNFEVTRKNHRSRALSVVLGRRASSSASDAPVVYVEIQELSLPAAELLSKTAHEFRGGSPTWWSADLKHIPTIRVRAQREYMDDVDRGAFMDHIDLEVFKADPVTFDHKRVIHGSLRMSMEKTRGMQHTLRLTQGSLWPGRLRDSLRWPRKRI